MQVLKVIYKKFKVNSYKHEKKIHEPLKNRYIVQPEKCFEDETCSYLVLEHCKKGSLRQLLDKGEKIPI